MSYQFLDANSSVLTAQSSVIGGIHYPIVIPSVIGSLPVSFGTVSVTGTVGASIIGTAPVNVNSVIGAVTLYAQPNSYISNVSSVLTGTGPTSILGAPGTGLRNYITTIKVTNAAATSSIVDIKDSGKNVLDTGFAAASGGGWSTTFPVPIQQPTTNASIDAVPRSQASILVTITGFIAP